jgi:rhodanese-related sulfurtransferase
VYLKAGQLLIRQGEPADYFYVIGEGRCEVLRGFTSRDKPVRVAEYGAGACLGEDALISNRLRNASVRMLTDGRIMRFDGDDFRFYLKRALARPVDYREAEQMVARGSRWLDVRMPDEARDGPHFANSLRIPHPIVRGRLFTADPTLSYVVVCAQGHDAPVIAFTLTKHGFDAYYLKHGAAGISR